MSSGSYDSSKDASSGNNSSYDYNKWNKPSEVIIFPTPIRPADSGIYALEQMGAAMRNSPNTVRTYDHFTPFLMSMIYNIDDLVYDDILAYPYDHMIPYDDDDDNYCNIIGNDNGGIISPPSSPRRPAMPYNFNVIYIEIPDENDNNLTHDTSVLNATQDNSIENDHDTMEYESNDDDDQAGHIDTEENDLVFLTSSSSHTTTVKTFIGLDDDDLVDK
ncbi:unnamed protein product [Rotaria socialis]|uniref:Uncharacterized protein n=1 Tax=Rotaria socialis TaxID=392032 RepID=A0A818ZF31_9BILA|nr:unnamed protein product [Rotaria socialis]